MGNPENSAKLGHMHPQEQAIAEIKELLLR